MSYCTKIHKNQNGGSVPPARDDNLCPHDEIQPDDKFTAFTYARHGAKELDAFLSSLSTLTQKIGGHPKACEILHPHQARHNSAGAVRSIIQERILKEEDFQREFKDFEELYEFVNSKIRHIDGIGDLAVYDIALRIGFTSSPSVRPQKYVYLACGAKAGARMITGKKRIGYRVSIGELLPYVSPLRESWHIENFLCIYHATHK